MNFAVAEAFELVRTEGDPDEPFQAGSLSKPVAAYAALRLVEAGELELDRDVNECLVSWQLPDGEGVTLRRLLTHTAGLGVPFFPGFEEGAELPTLVEVLDAVRVESSPGEFRYSGGGYVLVQLLLEDVTGRRFANLARELVFEPLGMTRSTFEQRAGRRYPEQAAAGLWTTARDLALFVGALQRYPAMQAPQVELPPDGEWSVVAQLGMVVPSEFCLAGMLVDGWFGHLGGAHERFSAYFGSREGGQAIVASGPQGEAPKLFAAVLAAADERGWKGLAA